MVSKNNLQWKQQRDAQRVPHYGLRKLSVGVASVLLSTTLYMGATAHADTVTTPSESATPSTAVTTDSNLPSTETVSGNSASNVGDEKSNQTNEANESQATPANTDLSGKTEAQPVVATPNASEGTPSEKGVMDAIKSAANTEAVGNNGLASNSSMAQSSSAKPTEQPADTNHNSVTTLNTTVSWTIHYNDENGKALLPDSVIIHDYTRTDTGNQMGNWSYVPNSVKVTGTPNAGWNIDKPDFKFDQNAGGTVFDYSTWQAVAASIKGYTPNYPSVAITDQLPKNPESLHATTTVDSGKHEFTFVYTQQPKTVKINYVNDDDNENVVKTDSVSGKLNTAVTITPNLPSGYMLTPGKDVPSQYTLTDADNQAVTIHVQKQFVDVSATDPQAKQTRTITLHYVYAGGSKDGQKAFDDAVLDVYYHRTATLDRATNQTTYGDWTWDKSQGDTSTPGYHVVSGKWTNLPQSWATVTADVPSIKGYYADLGQNDPANTNHVPANAWVFPTYNNSLGGGISEGGKGATAYLDGYGYEVSPTHTIKYMPSQTTVTVNYVDDDNNKVNVGSQHWNGTTGQHIDLTLTPPANYVLSPGWINPSSYDFDGVNSAWYTVHVKHATQDVTDQQSKDQISKTETLTRKHLYGPGPHEGEKFGEPDILEIPWHRTATKDLVTNKVSFGDWHVIWDEVKQLSGATKMWGDSEHNWVNGGLIAGHSGYSYLGVGAKAEAITTDGTVSGHGWYWMGEQDIENNPTIVQYYGREKVGVPVNYVDFDTNQQLTTKWLTGDDYLDGNTITLNKGDLTDWGKAVSSEYQLYAGQTLPTTYKIDTVSNNGSLTPITVYVVQPHTVQFTFADNDSTVNGQHLQVGDAVSVTGMTGSTTPVSLTVPVGYKLVEGQQLPTTYTFAKGETKQVILLTHQHVTVQPDAPKTPSDKLPDNPNKSYPSGVAKDDLSKTVTRKVTITTPDGKQTVTNQTVTFTRNATVDEVTGNVTYGSWSENGKHTFTTVNVPTVPGYTATSDVPSLAVTPDSKDTNVTINYTANDQTTQVVFVDDDDNGKTVDYEDIHGKTGETQKLTDLPENYELANGQSDTITFTTNTPAKTTVHLKHKVVTKQLKINVNLALERLIKYGYNTPRNGTEYLSWITDDELNSGEYGYGSNYKNIGSVTGSVQYDLVSGEVVKVNNGETFKFDDTILSNYPLDIDVANSGSLTGASDLINHTFADVLNKATHSNLNYKSYASVDLTKDLLANEESLNHLFIHKKNLVPVMFENGKQYGSDYEINTVKTDNPFLINFNDLFKNNYSDHYDVNENDDGSLNETAILNLPIVYQAYTSKTVTRTINVTSPDKTVKTIQQTAEINQNVGYDHNYLTGTLYKSDAYVTDNNWTAYTVPNIPGYTATQSQVEAVTVNGDTTDQTVNISYTANKQQVNVNYVDVNDGNKVVHTTTVNGVTDGDATVTNELPAGYKLVDGQSMPKTVHFNANNNDDINVKVQHATVIVTPDSPKTPSDKLPDNPSKSYPSGVAKDDLSKTVTRTININKLDGSKTTEVQSAKLTRTATVDEVTGEVEYGDWSTGQWDTYKVSSLKGYTPTQSTVDKVTVTGATKDQTVNVTYNASQQALTIRFVDEDLANDVPEDYLIGGHILTELDRTVTGKTGEKLDLNITIPEHYVFDSTGFDKKIPQVVTFTPEYGPKVDGKVPFYSFSDSNLVLIPLRHQQIDVSDQHPETNFKSTLTVHQVVSDFTVSDNIENLLRSQNVGPDYVITTFWRHQFMKDAVTGVVKDMGIVADTTEGDTKTPGMTLIGDWQYMPNSTNNPLKLKFKVIPGLTLNLDGRDGHETDPVVWYPSDDHGSRAATNAYHIVTDANGIAEISEFKGFDANSQSFLGQYEPQKGQNAFTYIIYGSLPQKATVHVIDDDFAEHKTDHDLSIDYSWNNMIPETAFSKHQDYRTLGNLVFQGYSDLIDDRHHNSGVISSDKSKLPVYVTTDGDYYIQPDEANEYTVHVRHKHSKVSADQPIPDFTTSKYDNLLNGLFGDADGTHLRYDGLDKSDLNKVVTRTIIVVNPIDGTKQTINQVAHLTRSADVDEATNKVKYDPWVIAKWETYQVPTINGYTPTQSQVNETTVTDTTKDQTVTVTYTADQQKLIVNFIDDTTGQTLKTVNKDGLTNSNSNYNTKSDIQDYVNNYYHLVSDDTNGQNLVFDNDDSKTQTYNVHLAHNTHDINDSNTVTETIHYKLDNGQKAFDDYNAQLSFTRTGYNDEATGQNHWNDWQATNGQTFNAVQSPSKEGYTPDKTSIEAVNVNPGDKNIDTTVTYNANAQAAKISYIDDTTGRTLKIDNANGKFNQAINFDNNVDNQIKDYEQQGYVLKSNNFSNQTYQADNAKNAFEVHLVHGTKNVQRTQKITETVQYQMEDGTKAPVTNSQSVDFTQDGVQDLVTNNIDWKATAPQQFKEVITPVMTGYTPDTASVPVTTVNFGDKDINKVVTYKANAQTAKISYIDDNTGETLKTDNANGKFNQAISFGDVDGAIKDFEDKGYQLKSNSFKGQKYQADNNSNVFEVHLVHGTKNVQRTQKITETVNYQMDDSSKAPATNNQSVDFTQDGVQDLVTKDIDWKATVPQQFKTVDTPTVTGYTPDITNVPATTVNFGDKNINKVVTYQANVQNATINYIDDTTGKTIKTDNANGKFNQPISFDNNVDNQIKAFENQGYVLKSNSFNGQKYQADNNSNVFEVHLVHGTKNVQRTQKITETVNYQMDDGSKAPVTTTQSVDFTQDGVQDLVTNNIDWKATEPQQFKAVNMPTVDGYTPDITNVPATTVNFGDKDINKTVTYKANPQSAKITYIDDNTGKTLKVDNANGKFNQVIDFANMNSGLQDFENQGYVLKSNSFNGQKYQADNANNTFEVHFTHGTKNVQRQDTITETVKYQYDNATPAHENNVQTLNFTQDGVQDLVTKNIDWKPTDAQEFKQVDTPAIDGYTPDITSIAATKVNFGDSDINKVVTYQANNQTANIHYVDDMTGSFISNDTANGKFGTTINFGNVNDKINTFKNLGYQLVSNGFNGQTYQSDNSKNVYYVHFTHGMKNVQRNKQITETIKYQYENGQQSQPDSVQTVSFNENGSQDLVTKKINWFNDAPQQFKAVSTPAITGYTADIDNIPAVVVSYDNDNINKVVTYKANSQTAKINYIDDTTGKVIKTDTANGKFNQAISFSETPTNVVNDLIKCGYKLVSNSFNGQTYQNDNNKNEFTVHLAHNTKNVSKQNTVTRTINYLDNNDKAIQAPIIETVTFTQNGITDLVTGNTTWDTPSSQTFETVKSPTIKGFGKPDVEVVEPQTVNLNDQNVVVNVHYSKAITPTNVNDNTTTPTVDHNKGKLNPTTFTTNTHQTTPQAHTANNGGQQSITPQSINKPSEQQTVANNGTKANTLPQTGNSNNNGTAMIGLGLLSGMFGLLGIKGKKKQD